MKLTEQQKKTYLAKGGFICPFCDSGNIEAEHLDLDGSCASCLTSCKVCHKAWRDVFVLTDVEDI